jgi:hypothetical protein
MKITPTEVLQVLSELDQRTMPGAPLFSVRSCILKRQNQLTFLIGASDLQTSPRQSGQTLENKIEIHTSRKVINCIN